MPPSAVQNGLPFESSPLEEVDFSPPVAMIFGEERHGVSDEMLRECDGAFFIPLLGLTESLNVSVATAVCCHFGRHQRAQALGIPPGKGDLNAVELEALVESYLQRGADHNFTAGVRSSRSQNTVDRG
eukprot:5171283-Amphidinium_carterae.1